MIGYFAGVLVASYVALHLVGSNQTLIMGLPVLLWLMVGVSALVILGLYLSFSNRNVNEQVTDIQTGAEVKDD
jgi:beta-lactamase regulating signal transducer with metallopeptidase domain